MCHMGGRPVTHNCDLFHGVGPIPDGTTRVISQVMAMA